ncbi:MAG TPA: oxygenase MpaB family protein [Acidimicrobiales bacterium]
MGAGVDTVEAHWATELARLRNRGDPGVDSAIRAFRSKHPELVSVRDLQRSVRSYLETEPVGEPPSDMAALFDAVAAQPSWPRDRDLISEGQEVFEDAGLLMLVALVHLSLPLSYGSVGGAEALVRISDLANGHLTRRVGETGQLLMATMARDGGTLEPGGDGYASVTGLRVFHGCARVLLVDVADYGWDRPRLGVPLNQEQLLAALVDFTFVTWAALERFGVSLTSRQREAHLHLWSAIGDLMGLEACQRGPLQVEDVAAIAVLLERELAGSLAGQRLTAALVDRMSALMPLGFARLPQTTVRWLFQGLTERSDDVPDLLGVPAASPFLSRVLDGMRSLSAARVPRPLRALRVVLIRSLGRKVLAGFVLGLSPEAAPFRLPTSLARRWHFRTGRVVTSARTARCQARAGVRAAARAARRAR